jgi:hypothetical protein
MKLSRGHGSPIKVRCKQVTIDSSVRSKDGMLISVRTRNERSEPLWNFGAP